MIPMHTLLELFYIFFQIGLFSIGGGYAIIPLIQEQVVEQYGWVSRQTFTNIITISQMTPGPLAVNTSTFIGIQIAGIPGAVCATLGCVISGVCICVCLFRFFRKHRDSRIILEILSGLKASSLGLIVSAAAVILLLTFCGTETLSAITQFDWFAFVLFLLSLFAIRRWKLHPMLMMVITGVLGGFAYLL